MKPVPLKLLRDGLNLARNTLHPGLHLSGWHDGEDWGRWSDGAEARLDLWLAAPLPLVGCVLALTLHGRPDGAYPLRVRVNDTELPVRTIDGNGTRNWPLPEACLAGREHLRIVLTTDRTIEAACFTPRDDRILGIALARLTIRSSP